MKSLCTDTTHGEIKDFLIKNLLTYKEAIDNVRASKGSPEYPSQNLRYIPTNKNVEVRRLIDNIKLEGIHVYVNNGKYMLVEGSFIIIRDASCIEWMHGRNYVYWREGSKRKYFIGLGEFR